MRQAAIEQMSQRRAERVKRANARKPSLFSIMHVGPSPQDLAGSAGTVL